MNRAFNDLPRKVLLIPSDNIHLQTSEAIRLIGLKRAREVFSPEGKFIGVELGAFGAIPTEQLPGKLPPAEIENCRFMPPATSPAPLHSLIMAMAYRGVEGVAEFA